jgi:hypothetical protein
MAKSYQFHIASGGTATFAFSEIDGYLSTSHLKVYVNGTATTAFTLDTTTKTVTLSTTPAAGAAVRIQRETPATLSGRVTDFVDGSVLTAEALDNANIQNLFIAQEAADSGGTAMGLTSDELGWDAQNVPIENLGLPVAGTDAVTKQYVDNLALAAGFGLAPAAVPQSWTLTPTANDQTTFTLTVPTPTSVDPNMYIVLIDGALQSPSAYTITETGGIYTLTLSATAGDITTDSVIHVRNFGISRTVSGSVNTALIQEAAVTAEKLALNAVTTDKILNEQVTEAKIGSLSVTEGKIGALAVTEAKIGPLAVTEGKIGPLAVTPAKLAASAVETDKIANAAITLAKIGFTLPVLQENTINDPPVGTIRGINPSAYGGTITVPGSASSRWFVAAIRFTSNGTWANVQVFDFFNGGNTTAMPGGGTTKWVGFCVRVS